MPGGKAKSPVVSLRWGDGNRVWGGPDIWNFEGSGELWGKKNSRNLKSGIIETVLEY